MSEPLAVKLRLIVEGMLLDPGECYEIDRLEELKAERGVLRASDAIQFRLTVVSEDCDPGTDSAKIYWVLDGEQSSRGASKPHWANYTCDGLYFGEPTFTEQLHVDPLYNFVSLDWMINSLINEQFKTVSAVEASIRFHESFQMQGAKEVLKKLELTEIVDVKTFSRFECIWCKTVCCTRVLAYAHPRSKCFIGLIPLDSTCQCALAPVIIYGRHHLFYALECFAANKDPEWFQFTAGVLIKNTTLLGEKLGLLISLIDEMYPSADHQGIKLKDIAQTLKFRLKPGSRPFKTAGVYSDQDQCEAILSELEYQHGKSAE